MAGISSKSAGKLENRYKYNGNELQHGEFNDGSGLEIYDANFRQRDPQIGRWWQLDPMMETHLNLSPYELVNNNPISFSDPLGLDTVRITGEGSHKIKIRQGDVLSLTIQNTTSYFTYDPTSKDAVNGFVGSGIEQDDSKSGESAITVVSDKKSKSESRFTDLGIAGAGYGIEYAGVKMFSKAAQQWFDPKQWKSYGQRFYGNQHTISQVTARRASLAFRGLGYGLGIYNQAGIFSNDDISGTSKVIETSSNLFTTLGGLHGAAFGIGWELGRMTTESKMYSNWFESIVLPGRNDFYRMIGMPVPGDPDYSSINKINTNK